MNSEGVFSGRLRLSDSKRKEVAGYAPGFQKWFAGVSGKSTVDNSILMPTQADQLELINKAAESQKPLMMLKRCRCSVLHRSSTTS
ncbi:hypothetical protein BANRA_02531 [Acinetobacter baumannii]|nr:hypothetical protein BANRA_02531 [Acinetobacter baumannii]